MCVSSTSARCFNDKNLLNEAFSIAERDHFQVTIDGMDDTYRTLVPIFIGEIESIFPYGNFFKERWQRIGIATHVVFFY